MLKVISKDLNFIIPPIESKIKWINAHCPHRSSPKIHHASYYSMKGSGLVAGWKAHSHYKWKFGFNSCFIFEKQLLIKKPHFFPFLTTLPGVQEKLALCEPSLVVSDHEEFLQHILPYHTWEKGYPPWWGGGGTIQPEHYVGKPDLL